MKRLVLVVLLAFSSAALAADEPIRLDLRLMASDLVDDMVYTWLQGAPVSGPTSLVVAEIDAPVGVDHRFDEEIENHLYELLRANPKLPLSLVHCALCRQTMAVSNPKRTVMGRALNMPEGQEMLSHYPHTYALALHFDVVERDLALWAEIYEIASPQRVVWAKRYSTSTSSRALLQDPNHLVSISEAREEQRKIIAGHDSMQTITRFPVRTFAAASNANTTAEIPPVIFLEQWLEGIMGPHRNRRAGVGFGLTSIKDAMQGWSLGASYAQLLFRDEPSLTQPDVWVRFAATYMRLEGPQAAVFGSNQLDVNHLINSDDTPRAGLMGYQLGIEVFAKNRIGLGAFVEYIPLLDSNQAIATRNILVPFHSLGVTGVFLW